MNGNGGSKQFFWEKVEHFVDRAIPYLIIVLFFIVILDVFYKEIAEHYHNVLFTADSIIISFFVADLTFKYNRVRDISRFVRTYWIDIAAVFPFFLLLRLFEEILLISERSALTLRNLFHAGIVLEEGVVASEQAARIARTSEVLAKEGRLVVFSERLAFLRRVPRLLKAFSFYEHPSQKKTLYHKKEKKKTK
ncbi:hypothetical protein JXB27_04540 [Candidatus Woesearchaeota archaeon]|nr:hypothetical protein [Candidatus Woesearchaeota archaeon]